MTLIARPAAVSAALTLALLLLYIAFPTRVYYWDGIAFAQMIEDASGLNISLAHPNHLIYNFAGYLFYRLLRTLGFELRALTALQILNSILSVASAIVLFAILRDALRSLYLSICLTLLFSFSATWWKFSTDANAYIPSVLFLLVCFFLILPDRKPAPVLLALTFFVSMCFHQLAVIAYPVLALGVYLQDGAVSIRGRVKNALTFSLLSFFLIAVTYAVVFYFATGTFGLGQLIRWTVSYSPDADRRFNLWSNLAYSLRGQVRLFLGGRFGLLEGLVNPAITVLLVLLGVAVLFLIFAALWNLRKLKRHVRSARLEPRQKTVLLLSLLWSGVYLAFLFVWLPQNTFYRLFYLPALILLLGLALAAFEQSGLRRMFTTAIFVGVIGLANFLFLIYPSSHEEKYPPLAFAREMNREWPAGTVVYYAADNSHEGLVRYFNPSTRWLLLKHQLPESELAKIYNEGGSAWFETTAIDQLSATVDGARWLNAHARPESLRELISSKHRIRFVQVVPSAR
jgi:hypothetical protein